MIIVPTVISMLWVLGALARKGGQEVPLAPTTTVGRVALASLALIVIVALTGAPLAITVPAGGVMLGLAAFARWVRHDGGLLVVIPVTFGFSLLVLPLVFE